MPSALMPTAGAVILGQPYKLKAIVPQVLIACACDAKEPLLMIGIGATALCPACQRQFVMQAVHAIAGGALSAEIGVGIPRTVADA